MQHLGEVYYEIKAIVVLLILYLGNHTTLHSACVSYWSEMFINPRVFKMAHDIKLQLQ